LLLVLEKAVCRRTSVRLCCALTGGQPPALY